MIFRLVSFFFGLLLVYVIATDIRDLRDRVKVLEDTVNKIVAWEDKINGQTN